MKTRLRSRDSSVLPYLAQILQSVGPPWKEGRRIRARSGQARMRPLGHVGTGAGSPRIKDPESTGVLEDSAAQARSVSGHLKGKFDGLPQKEGKDILSSKTRGSPWNSLRLTKSTWNVC